MIFVMRQRAGKGATIRSLSSNIALEPVDAAKLSTLVNSLRGAMRILRLFVMVIPMMMSILATSQTLTAPQAITDPKQIASKPDARVEKSLSIEKLYTTRQVGGSTWSPDGKTIAFVSNLS